MAPDEGRVPVERRRPRRRASAWAGAVAAAVVIPMLIVSPSDPPPPKATEPEEPVPEELPVSMPDPVIAEDDGTFVLATTQTTSSNVPSWTVEDPGDLADPDAWAPADDLLPELPSWAAPGQTWSPSLHERSDGTWVLFAATTHASSGVQCILAAGSPEPTGPFVAVDDPVTCDVERGGSIDPYVAVIDGDPILYWATNGLAVEEPMALHGAALDESWTALAGEPVQLLEADQSGEGQMVSAPTVVTDPEGRLHLVYSSGEWGGPTYALGTAICEGPLGPCERAPAPALAVEGAPSGTAGAKPLRTSGGALRFALHGPSDDPAAVGARELVLADGAFVDGELRLEVST